MDFASPSRRSCSPLGATRSLRSGQNNSSGLPCYVASQVTDAIRKHHLSVAWAAFSAAERQVPMVTHPRIWLMANDDYVDALRDALEANAVDSGANLTILVPPDAVYLARTTEPKAGRCTHPLQTYVDVWHAGAAAVRKPPKPY